MGLEYITQPQIFLAPITAVNGIQGINEAYPLLTTYQTWTSTASVPASVWPIPGTWTMLDEAGSFIITVGGVVQDIDQYTVNRNLRLLTFTSPVSAGIEIVGRQLATAAPSSQSFNYIQSVSGSFTSLSAGTGTFDTLLVTNLTGLSTVVNIIDVRISEVSGFSVTGNLGVLGTTTTTDFVATNATITNATVTDINATTAIIDSQQVTSLTGTSILITDGGTLIGATSSTSIGIGSLSARTFNLVHDPANDGVDPIFDIGETLTGSFSGFRIRYEEPTNRLIGSGRTGTTVLTSFIITTNTGQVGISGLPAPGQALTVSGNISASGSIRAINTWPNRQYFILSADGPQFAANTVSVTLSERPLTIQPNLLYTTSVYVILSSVAAAQYTIGLSGNAPFSILEGIAHAGAPNTDPGNPYLARDLRELNTGAAAVHTLLPAKTYTSVGPHGFIMNPIISAASTTQILVSCVANQITRAKSSSNYSASIIQTV
jgi:hypothetical protein